MTAHLAARRRYRQDGADGQAGARRAEPRVEIPYVAALFVGRAVAYRLRGVYDAAPAYGENKVHGLAAAELYPLAHERKTRVRHDAAQLDEADARLAQRRANPAEQPRALRAPAAVMQQNLFAAELRDELPGLIFSSAPEHNLRRRVIRKILYHQKISPQRATRRGIFLLL